MPDDITTGSNCPICGASFKERKPEKFFRYLNQKGAHVVPAVGYRDEYICGAVQLTNAQNPNGSMEAMCCTVPKDT